MMHDISHPVVRLNTDERFTVIGLTHYDPFHEEHHKH